MLFKLSLITIAIQTQLIFQTKCQELPEDVCVSGAENNFTRFNGEYELEGTHNGFPYYKKDECSTQYLYAYYYSPDDLHYYTFYSELTIEYPASDPDLPECGAEGQDWIETPSDPTQCVNGWVVYATSLENSTYTQTDIIVQSGECHTEIECDSTSNDSTSNDSTNSDSTSNENIIADKAQGVDDTNDGKQINIDNNNNNNNVSISHIIIIIVLMSLFLSFIGVGIGFWCVYNKNKNKGVYVNDFEMENNDEYQDYQQPIEQLTEFSVILDEHDEGNNCGKTSLNI